MKHTLRRTTYFAIFCLISSSLFFSCVPQKKINYLQKMQAADTASVYRNIHLADYKVQPKDNLYIRIFALDERAFSFFNKQSGASSFNDFVSDAAIYLNSYTVNAEGFIDFPVIGKVQVADMTIDQVKYTLQQLVSEYLKDITVVVKLVNFKVSVLGEVNHPGEFTIYKDNLNIFEAITQAGDMSEFANRNRVALIRQSKNGSQVHYLDLTSDKILTSEYFKLQSNDIVYVSPLGYKRWGLGSTFPWAIVLTSISTTLLLINYFKK
jgi:polysaccharide biosynthesis/export protein